MVIPLKYGTVLLLYYIAIKAWNETRGGEDDDEKNTMQKKYRHLVYSIITYYAQSVYNHMDKLQGESKKISWSSSWEKKMKITTK